MDKYCYNGLLWFGQGEDVKIFDADSGKELLEHTLSERKDEIELPPLELPYIIESQYYMEDAGDIVTILSDRTFQKVNNGPSYGFGCWTGTESLPMLLSKDQNAVLLSWHYVTHSFEYEGETWYAGGNGYGYYSDCASVNRLDISSYGPFSEDATENYKLGIIQKATAALNIIYNKNVPIPQSL